MQTVPSNRESTTVTEGTEATIARKLQDGESPPDLIRKGYVRSTVYKVQQQLRRDCSRDDLSAASEQPDAAYDPVVEEDPEVVELKKQLRRAQIEREIRELEAPLEIESFYGLVETLEERFDKLDRKVRGTPLLGLRDRFECSKCGEAGHVAAVIICTECGEESSWGWWPSEDK